MLSTPYPTEPACVKVVASQIVKGTFKNDVIVLASKVFPEPEGPISIILLFPT